MAVVQVSNLTKAYGPRPPALVDVTLEIGEGVTGLLGPNGAGKSTLIQCVLGLLRDFSGTATVLGLDARRDRLAIRKKVGYMPESDSMIPGMSAVASCRYLAELSGMARSPALRRAHECLHYVGLTDALYRQAEGFSTGMRQRLKLAQALVHDPQMLFLDEPISGMDPAGRDEFLSLVRSLSTEHGKQVVWSSHMLPDVQRVADSILVLDRGTLRGSFRLEDLHGATGRWEMEGEGDAAAFDGALAERGLQPEAEATDAGAAPDLGTGIDGRPRFRRVARVLSPDAPAPLLAAAFASGARLRRVTPVVERLEDVFHRLLGPRGPQERRGQDDPRGGAPR